MARLWSHLRELRKEKFETLKELGVAMQEAGCRRRPEADSFSSWLRRNGEKVPLEDLVRLLAVLETTLEKVVPYMDDEDLVSYVPLWIAIPGTGDAVRGVLRRAVARAGTTAREIRGRTRRPPGDR